MYVQDRLRESGKLVWQLLQEGAHFYVCGDAAHMAGSVEQALLHIFQHHQVWPATECTSPFGYDATYLSSYKHSAWSVRCALLSIHNIIFRMHGMQHSAEAFHGLTVSTLHCMVSSLQQHAILCRTMVSHIPCCVLRAMGIHRVQSSTWRLYDNRSATRGMFGSEKHYPVTLFLRQLVRDALFRTGDKRMTTSSLLD